MTFLKTATAMLILLCQAVVGEEAPRPLKILCWNLHHGVGMDGKLDLPRIAAVIRAQDPDIVALQEMDRNCKRSAVTDQAAVLGDLTGMKSAFGEARPFDGGSYGQAILSKHPIESTRVVRLSETNEPRIAFIATILHPAGPLTMVSTHLNHQSLEQRLGEAHKLVEALEKIPGPLILAGDFNDLPDSPVLALFKAPWMPVKGISNTFPATKPTKTIDYIISKGFKGPSEGAVVNESVASDHRPITATFVFP